MHFGPGSDLVIQCLVIAIVVVISYVLILSVQFCHNVLFMIIRNKLKLEIFSKNMKYHIFVYWRPLKFICSILVSSKMFQNAARGSPAFALR